VALLSDDERQQLRQVLDELKTDVRLVFFTQTLNCETCEIAGQILGEVAALSDRISVDERNYLLDKEGAAALRVDRVPAVAIMAAVGEGQVRDSRIRMYGAPHGYEFASLLDAILLVGGAEQNGLSAASRALLQSLTEPVHLQVFVTPT
jgi:alkyl hydroperoxide reductase subunit AhpF